MLTRNLPCKLTAAEHAARSDTLAGLVVQIDEREISAKTAAKVAKEEIDELKIERTVLGRVVHTHTEYREVEVVEQRDFDRKCVETIRTDTGEVVDTRAMTPGELQLQLEIVPEEPPSEPEIVVVPDDAERVA